MPDDAPRVLSLLAHELRGPLGVIRGYLRLLDQSAAELSEQSRQSVAAALGASDRMAEVLDEASFLAHLRVGDVRLEPRQVPLPGLVRAAIQAAALPDAAVVDVNPADLAPFTVCADEDRLRGALATLIAAVARPQSREVVVAITAVRSRTAGQDFVELHFAAPQIAGGDVSEVELNQTRGGFGLTVPIAAAIVEGHGGRIRELRSGDRGAGIIVSIPVG
jgi:signal transduction histidine kinase